MDIIEADVVVIGGGGAGLSAAAEAAAHGAKVVVLEKNPEPGGSTSWSVGSVTATDTPHQHRAGIQDDAQAHFEDLALHAGPLVSRDNLALRRLLVDNISETLRWLMDLGVVFVGPEAEPPHRVPRMHNVVPNSKAFAYHLARHCRRLGVDLRVNIAAQRFLEKDGKVMGVEARQPDGSLVEFHASRGVILASGDYSNAPDLKERLASPDIAQVDAVNPTATGDGHRMALDLGASILNGDIVRGPIMRFVPPTRGNFIQKLPPSRAVATLIAWSMRIMPKALLRPFLMSFLTTALGPSPDIYKQGGVLINKRGERFVDETQSPNAAVARQPDRISWIVFDHATARKFAAWPYFISTAPGVAYAYLADYRRNRADIYRQAETLPELAAGIGVPAQALCDSIEAYNGDGQRNRPPLAKGPFYALGPVKSYVVFTDGGLAVNEDLRVLRADGSVIDGLYAAGSAGQGGLLLEGHGHHLGWAFVSGRIAGRKAAMAHSLS